MQKPRRILVTGGSGKAGRFVVRELLAHGYEVTNVDWKPSAEVHTFQVELTDLGQVFGVLEGQDAILHLAAYPWAGEHAAEVVFRNNVVSTYNILQASTVLGVKKIVLAGSESSLGFPFKFTPILPQYLPIDEEHPLLAQDPYGLSKMTCELLAQGYCRRDPSLSITCLRLSYVLRPEDYLEELRVCWADEERNNFNLWAYIDARDCAAAFRLALETAHPGFEACYIAARDTLMRQPTLELVRRYFPGDYPVKAGFSGRMSPLDGSRAQTLLGFTPQYTWEMQVNANEIA